MSELEVEGKRERQSGMVFGLLALEWYVWRYGCNSLYSLYFSSGKW